MQPALWGSDGAFALASSRSIEGKTPKPLGAVVYCWQRRLRFRSVCVCESKQTRAVVHKISWVVALSSIVSALSKCNRCRACVNGLRSNSTDLAAPVSDVQPELRSYHTRTHIHKTHNTFNLSLFRKPTTHTNTHVCIYRSHQHYIHCICRTVSSRVSTSPLVAHPSPAASSPAASPRPRAATTSAPSSSGAKPSRARA